MTNFKTGMHRTAYDKLSNLLEVIAKRGKFPDLRLKLGVPNITPALPEVSWEASIYLDLPNDPGEWPGAIKVMGVKGSGRLLVRFYPGGEEALVGAARPLAHVINVMFEDEDDFELVGGDKEGALKDYVTAAMDSLDWTDIDQMVSWNEAEDASKAVDAALLEPEFFHKME